MKRWSRRSFLSAIAGCALVPVLAFAQQAIKVAVIPNHFPAQPDSKPLGAMHGGAAIDRAGNVYVSTDTERGILVFSADGKFKRNFGPSMIHGLSLTREKDGEYLYGARPTAHEVIKIKTDGTTAWTMGYPEASGVYTKAEEFNPTNMVALSDGTIFVADGYGKNYIHKFDRTRKYLKSFGGQGAMPAEEGKFNRCHGLAVDLRGSKPMLIVCNRESGRVEQWDTDGNFVKVLQKDLRMPAAAHVANGMVAIAELQGRVTVLGKDNSIVAQVGDNPDEAKRANYNLEPAQWKDDYCNSPHSVVIDKKGNVVVAEWSKFGRLNLFSLKK